MLSIGALAVSGGLDFSKLVAKHPPKAIAAQPVEPDVAPAVAPEAPPPPPADAITIASRNGATWSELAASLQAGGVSLIFDDIDPTRESAAFHVQESAPEAVLSAMCLAAGWEQSGADGIHRLRKSPEARCKAVLESQGLVNREKLPKVTVNTATASRTLGEVAEAMRLSGGVNYLIADTRLADFPMKKFALVDKPLAAVMGLVQESGAPMEWTFEGGVLVMVPCTRAK